MELPCPVQLRVAQDLPRGRREKERGQGKQSRGSAPCPSGLLHVTFPGQSPDPSWRSSNSPDPTSTWVTLGKCHSLWEPQCPPLLKEGKHLYLSLRSDEKRLLKEPPKLSDAVHM